MDIFHRNPAHQASLLDKLDRKYESLIKVAGCHFRLTASPIVSKEGWAFRDYGWMARPHHWSTKLSKNFPHLTAAAGDFSQKRTDRRQTGLLPDAGEQLKFANSKPRTVGCKMWRAC